MPDPLWELVRPLLPPAPVRPQGGGRRRVDDRLVFAAIVFVCLSGCSWRQVSMVFDLAAPTVHRRFQHWTRAGVWAKLHRAILDELGHEGLIDWSRSVIDSISVRAEKGGI